MSAIKKLYRTWIAPAIVATGMERLLSATQSHRNLILCYHGVSKNTNPLNNRHLLFSQFEKHLIYLKTHFQVVPMNRMFSEDQHARQKKRIAITFDDGYKNNLDVALPLLEKHQLPATFFIATQGLDQTDYLMWPDIFDLLRFDPAHDEYEFNKQIFVKSNNRIVCKNSGEAITDVVKKMGSERDGMIDTFREKYRIDTLTKYVPKEMYEFMSRNDLALFATSPFVDIGSHTHKHYNLANIDPDLAKNELETSKAILENIVQKPVRSIAYPDGSYNDAVKDLAQTAGYDYQLAVDYRSATDLKDPRILARHGVSNTTTYEANMIQFNRQFAPTGF